ncbi:hypothetical protein FOZ60_008823 [Perkinsus olseni]|uniref:Cyanocobalamin reductase (cyanide-eliminating) n=1 Tax=Perkinsus olseni TaxID=32597 RepID=A0A7J6NIA3_PEROL|nr:hypothetical protein FOZ60_008823 [Perkinsus olseni]
MVERILRRCEEVLAGVGMEATPFVVDWYNDFRLEVAADMPQLIEVSGRNRLGVVCLSNKNFFRSAVLGTYRKNIEDGGEAQRKFDFVAEASDDVGRMLRPLLVEEIGRDESFIRVMNVDKPPFLHVQSIGHAIGLDMHLAPEYLKDGPELTEWEAEVRETMHDVRDPDLWGSAYDKILGLNLHPKYGGWYAYRLVVVIDLELEEALCQPPRCDIGLTEQQKRDILMEFNTQPDLGRWRDLPDGRTRRWQYDAGQYMYFHEKNRAKRARFMELMYNESTME